MFRSRPISVKELSEICVYVSELEGSFAYWRVRRSVEALENFFLMDVKRDMYSQDVEGP